MTLKVGDHTFEIFHTPGHSPEQTSIYCPEERVVFVGDNIFNGCQIWFHSIDFDALFKSLDWLQSLDVDYIIPGHGPVKGKECIAENKQFIYEWLSVVGDAIINKGWTRQECIDRINFADRCPVDIGQQDCMEYISTNNGPYCLRLYRAQRQPVTEAPYGEESRRHRQGNDRHQPGGALHR